MLPAQQPPLRGKALFRNAACKANPKLRSMLLMQHVKQHMVQVRRRHKKKTTLKEQLYQGVKHVDKLTMSQHLYNAVTKLYQLTQDTFPTQANPIPNAWPLPPDNSDEVLTALLEETKKGRGLVEVFGMIRCSLSAPHIAHAATMVLLCTLLMIQEVSLKQSTFEEQERKRKMELKAIQAMRSSKPATSKGPWGRVRMSVQYSNPSDFTKKLAMATSATRGKNKSPTSSVPATTLRDSPLSMGGERRAPGSPGGTGTDAPASPGSLGNNTDEDDDSTRDGAATKPGSLGRTKAETRRSSMNRLLEVLKRDGYGSPSSMAAGLTSAQSHQASQEPEATVTAGDTGLTHLTSTKTKLPPPHWLPETPSTSTRSEKKALEDYRVAKHLSFTAYGKGEEWAAVLVRMHTVSILGVLMHCCDDMSLLVTCMGVLNTLIDMAPGPSIEAMLAPMEENIAILADAKQARASAVRVSSNLSVTTECAYAVVLRLIQTHRNNFVIQGSGAQVTHSMFELGGPEICSRINAVEACDVLVHYADQPVAQRRLRVSNSSKGRPRSRSRSRTRSAASIRDPATDETLQRRVEQVTKLIENRFGIVVPPQCEWDLVGHRSNATQMIRTLRHRPAKVAGEDQLAGNTAPRMFLRMLRRWNLGGDRERDDNREHSADFIMSHLTAGKRRQLLNAHLEVTKAVCYMFTYDQHVNEYMRGNVKALDLLTAAMELHKYDAKVEDFYKTADLTPMKKWSSGDLSSSSSGSPQLQTRLQAHAQAQSPSSSSQGQRPGNMRLTAKQLHTEVRKSRFTQVLAEGMDEPPRVPGPLGPKGREGENLFSRGTSIDSVRQRPQSSQARIQQYAFDRLKPGESVGPFPAGGEIIAAAEPTFVHWTGAITTGMYPPRPIEKPKKS